MAPRLRVSACETPETSLLADIAAKYPVAITPEIAALIDPDDPNDPIARQFVPSEAELDTALEERADPIGDDRHSARCPVSSIATKTACSSSRC